MLHGGSRKVLTFIKYFLKNKEIKKKIQEMPIFVLQLQHPHLGIGHPRHLVHRLVIKHRLYSLVDNAVTHGEYGLVRVITAHLLDEIVCPLLQLCHRLHVGWPWLVLQVRDKLSGEVTPRATMGSSPPSCHGAGQ